MFKHNRIVVPCAKRHIRQGSPISPGHTGLNSSDKECRVWASGEPANHRQHYLLLVDYYYSNFFELAQLVSNTHATCVIDAKRSQFAYHGSPELLASDNGHQFSCREFRKFTQLWDIEHVTSSPRYPQSNGQAEWTTRSVNNMLNKALEDGSDAPLAL